MENEVKEPAPKYNYISPEEYREHERASREKHEYYDGQVFTMAGASMEHVLIACNVNRLISPVTEKKGCKLFGNDFRLHIPENFLFTYPDFSIVCGDISAATIYKDNLVKPVVIIEILSKTTKDYDRGTKFMLCRQIPTLAEYIMIDSTNISVEQYIRQSTNKWILSEFKHPDDKFVIISIDFTVTLRELYRDVNMN